MGTFQRSSAEISKPVSQLPIKSALHDTSVNIAVVSVGQKTSGYKAGSLDFTDELLKTMEFVDASLGLIVQKLKAKGIYDDTLIIIASKHGQAPIDPTKYGKVDPLAVTNATGVDVAFQTVRPPFTCPPKFIS